MGTLPSSDEARCEDGKLIVALGCGMATAGYQPVRLRLQDARAREVGARRLGEVQIAHVTRAHAAKPCAGTDVAKARS